MSAETTMKVTASHLARTAFLYVRQSTVRQVLTNTESTVRQYALRQRAVALAACWRSAVCPTRLSATRTAYTTRPISMIGCCSA